MDQNQPQSYIKISSDEKAEELKEKIHQMAQRDSEGLLRANAIAAGLGYVNLPGHVIIEECYQVIPEETAKRLGVVCFEFSRHHSLKLACPEYSSEIKTLAHSLSEKLETPVSVCLSSKESVQYALRGYARIPKMIPFETVEITSEQIHSASHELGTFEEFGSKLSHANVSEAVVILLAAALKFQSSDLHVEDEQNGTAVRFRIDGVLHPVVVVPSALGKQIIARIKLISRLKINVSDRPQDGHFDVNIQGEKVDVRVSALPTNYGESLALRILSSTSGRITFDRLGMFSWTKAFLEKEIVRPAGMLVVCGPTGSGKTTSLYSILLKVSTPGVKILTIEDPIEYEIKGVSQSQVNEEKGYTFAKGLRSLVRQDPDVIMIGEIRDAETVDIALQASLTGHLVLSTLHTNSSAGAIPRFLAMGAKPYLLAPALNAVMSQRLIRKLCQSCKEPTVLSAEQNAIFERELPHIKKYFGQLEITKTQFFTNHGCSTCSGIGFQGRIGIFEHLSKTAELEKQILSASMSEARLKEIQNRQGMVSMLQDGLLKCLLGSTTVEEIMRVVDVE